MLDNLVYCLNGTVPIFVMMLLGLFLRKINYFSQAFADKLNSYVFKVGLPVMMFKDLTGSDFFQVWDTSFVLFCFFATLLSILLTALLSRLLKERPLRGEFIQVGYRSSVALLGAAFLENLYGNAGAASLVIIGAVPLYNAAAVTVLSLTSPTQNGLSKGALKKVAKGVATNPIILGIVVGLVWTLLRLPIPTILEKSVSSVSATATPLGLMALGASFDWKKALGRIRPALGATCLKLVVFVAIFLPVAVAMGFRDDKLVATLTLLGSPTTVSCFVMARNLGHEGTITSSTVMLTTAFSAFTLTLWLYLLKSMAFI
ncbi:AEC family transporter [Pseudoflavonifractor phocaeensis]|uniref:AEC family transporter n=1 Tax=Pseudoflavonifractor phocaeensis TaxID=1870988 RepID=UPI002FF5F1C1